MIEAKVERVFVEKFKNALKPFGVQVVGTWDVSTLKESADATPKAEEEAGTSGVLVVKIQPRQYATPTVPDATLNGAISLSIRADVDWSGKTYLDVCDIVIKEMEKLQQCYHSTHQEYSIPDEGFVVTGFQLGSGDTSVNTTNKVFSYSHTFTVYGVIQTPEW